MRRGRLALVISLSVIAVLAIAVVVLLNFGLGNFKGYTEELASEALGRKLEIRGTFAPKIGRSIRLTAEDIHLAATDWSKADDLLVVAHLDLSIDLWTLIRGPIMVESVNISGITVNLEERADGQNNWTMGAETDAGDSDASAGIDKLPLLIRSTKIRDFALTYASPSMKQPLAVTVDSVDEVVSDAGEVSLNASGDVNKTPFSITSTTTNAESLINLSDVATNFQGTLGEVSFGGNTVIDHVLSPSRPTLNLELHGPNAEYVTDIFGLQRITTGPLSLDASVSPEDKRMHVTVDGKFGEFTIDTNSYFVDLQNLDDLQIHADASGPNAATIGRLLGNDAVPEDPYQLELDAKLAGRSLQLNPLHLEIGATKVDASASFSDFRSPDGASAKIQISGPDFGRFNKLFGLPGKLTGPFQLDASVSALPDKKAAVVLDASAKDLSLALKGTMVDAPAFAGTTLNLTASGPNFATIAQTIGLQAAPAESFELSLAIDKETALSKIANGQVRIGNDRLKIAGQVGDKPLRRDTNLQFSLSGPDFRKTLIAYGVEAAKFPATAWSASGNVFRGQDQFVLQAMQASIGSNREYVLNFDGHVDDVPGYVGSAGKIAFTGSDFGALAAAAGTAGMSSAPIKLSATVERAANGYSVNNGELQLGNDQIRIDGLIGDEPLQRDTSVSLSISASDLQKTLQGFGLEIDEVPAGPLTASGQIAISGSTFALRNVSAKLAGATLTVNGRLGAMPSLDHTDIDLVISGEDLSKLLPAGEHFSATTDQYSLKSKVRIDASKLALQDLIANVGQANLKGSLSATLDPLLNRGDFSLQADAADFGKLVQRYSDYSARAGVPMTFNATGNWDKNFWNFDEFIFTLADGRLAIKGSLDGPPDFTRTNLQVDLHVASVKNLSSLAGRDLPAEVATLRAHLIGTKDLMTLDDFEASLGKSDIDGEFSLRAAVVPKAEVKLTSKVFDVSGYLPPLEKDAKKPPTEKKDKILPTAPLKFDVLHKFDATVDVRIGELVLRQRSVKNIVLVGALDDGVVKVSNFNLESARGGTLSGALLLRDVDTGADLTLNLTGRKLGLGLPAETPEALAELPQYDVDAVLKGSGTTVAELAGSLNGFTRIVSGPGKLKASAMRMFTQDFLAQIFNTVNPFAKTDPYSNVKCAAVLLKATDGRVVGQPALVVQTDKLNIFANADIDLKTEKLVVELNTVPQTGLGLSLSNLVTPYTKVGGTLANPTLALDAQGAIVQGGAAVATAGISFLATRFKDRYLSAKDACGKAIDDTNAEFQQLQKQYDVATR